MFPTAFPHNHFRLSTRDVFLVTEAKSQAKGNRNKPSLECENGRCPNAQLCMCMCACICSLCEWESVSVMHHMWCMHVVWYVCSVQVWYSQCANAVYFCVKRDSVHVFMCIHIHILCIWNETFQLTTSKALSGYKAVLVWFYTTGIWRRLRLTRKVYDTCPEDQVPLRTSFHWKSITLHNFPSALCPGVLVFLFYR